MALVRFWIKQEVKVVTPSFFCIFLVYSKKIFQKYDRSGSTALWQQKRNLIRLLFFFSTVSFPYAVLFAAFPATTFLDNCHSSNCFFLLMSYNNRVLSNDNFDCKLSISIVPRNVTVSVEKKSRTMKQIATSADFVRVFLARSENHARFFPARKVKNGKSGSNSNLRRNKIN